MRSILAVAGIVAASGLVQAEPAAWPLVDLAAQRPNTWVKRSPLPEGPPSARKGYESAWTYDLKFGRTVRIGGHDPGGGGAQYAETWIYDPARSAWELRTPNTSPPGNCCCRENGFDPVAGLHLRFSYPSLGHGWNWDRHRLLQDDSVWSYDYATNRWTNMRPAAEPALNVGKGVVFDTDHQVMIVYDTKTRVYDPYTNTWHRLDAKGEFGKRGYFAMAYDEVHKKVVQFGSHYRDDPATRTYDLRANEWTVMNPPTHPPHVKTSPTMVYDTHHGVMLCVVMPDLEKTKDDPNRRLETWVYDLGKNAWTKMNPPLEPDFSGNRNRLMAWMPEHNLALLENRTGNEQQIWTYRYAAVDAANDRPLPRPDGLRVVTEGDAATLTWNAAADPRVKGHHVYRGDGALPWQATFKRLSAAAIRGTTYRDAGLTPGTIYYYYVAPAAADGAEGLGSWKVRTQPRVPTGVVVSALAANKVLVEWPAFPETDVVGYHVERAPVEVLTAGQMIKTRDRYTDKRSLGAVAEKVAIGPFTRLTQKPVAGTQWTDTSVDLAKKIGPVTDNTTWRLYLSGEKPRPEDNPEQFDMKAPAYRFGVYLYRVRAVNALGVESGPSPYVYSFPDAPQGLFSKEDGTTALLRWEPSQTRELKGYLVYRQDGRGSAWDKDSQLRLLTPEPITATTYTDSTAGGKTRRYHVIAVDALDQEGLASAPAWSRRPWRQMYKPFEAEWHQ